MKTDKWIFILSLAALVCGGCKQSDSKVVSDDVPDYTQMKFAEIKAAADKGSPTAQFELGERFHNGNGVPKDPEGAVEWWRRAATRMFPPAEYDLGLAYGRGEGVPKDREEGMKWCRMAADAHLPIAEDFLGVTCLLGSSVTQNYSEAFRWFKSAADQNYPPSQYRLALCYRDGKGTETNLTESILWLQRAASNQVANAQAVLGKYYYVTGCAEILAELGITNSTKQLLSQTKLDATLNKEQRNNPNFFIGVSWFRKAANQGYPIGQEYLALACATGFGTDKDNVEACKWLSLASIKESNVVVILIENWKTNKITFTSEQITSGKQRAEEFSKTNQISPKFVSEIPGL